MRRHVLLGALLGALALGLGIAWVDSRPGWDDTGVTAGLVILSAAAFGAAMPRHPWLWALAIGAWIPLVAIVQSRNAGALLALAIAFAGAYAGWGARAAWASARQ
jgi:hypothetical protein